MQLQILLKQMKISKSHQGVEVLRKEPNGNHRTEKYSLFHTDTKTCWMAQ